MSTGTISIAVDADAAQTFCAASPEVRRKLELLLRLRLRELTLGRMRSSRGNHGRHRGGGCGQGAYA